MIRVLTAIILCTLSILAADSAVMDIKVNQAGYPTRAPKLAMVVSQIPATEFLVKQAGDGSVAFKGTLTAAAQDADSGDAIQTADFSRLEKSGKYFLEVPGVGRSWTFTIGEGIYSRALYLATRSFFGQRCGTAVDLAPDFPGYSYAACHTRGEYHASSGKTGTAPSVKGWHDAGDYGRYIVNSGITTGTLLWTWELFQPKLRKVNLHIPESGNKTPDFLDEIRWNLDWMLSMQDQDGGVWHKQTTERFSGFVMPEQDTAPSCVIGTGADPFKSTCATADFAAVMAIAGRVYRPFDAGFAHQCAQAAKRAWTWAEQHPGVLFRNPAGVQTGGYGDRNCGDELLWASAELWRTTGEETYHKYFLAHFSEFRSTLRSDGPPSWAMVGPLGLWTYALGKKHDAVAARAIVEDSVKAADQIVERSNQNGYRISLTSGDYIWGSNSVAANYGLQLLVTQVLRPNPKYLETARNNLHYLLGRNTFSLSWVTQVGENAFKHPHHRPSGADNNSEPWPGLLSGGPNRGRQDEAMRKLPADLPPAKMHVDDQASYSSNENAINWNAALVFLLAGVE